MQNQILAQMIVKNPVWAEKAFLTTNEDCLPWSSFSTSICFPFLKKTSCPISLPREQDSPCADGDLSRTQSLCTTTAVYRGVASAKQEVSAEHVCPGEAGTQAVAQNHTVQQHTFVPSSRQTSFWSVLERLTCTITKCRPPIPACPHPELVHHLYTISLNEQSDFRNQEAFFWLSLPVWWPCTLSRCRGEHEVITPSEYEV